MGREGWVKSGRRGDGLGGSHACGSFGSVRAGMPWERPGPLPARRGRLEAIPRVGRRDPSTLNQAHKEHVKILYTKYKDEMQAGSEKKKM
jgi:hypothetical protein